VREPYTAEEIARIVANNSIELFAEYSAGRPPNWSVNNRTRELVCIAKWMNQEMVAMGLDDLGRRMQEAQFNRFSRSDEDLYALAARIMNDTLEDRIDRKRKPHRRWG